MTEDKPDVVLKKKLLARATKQLVLTGQKIGKLNDSDKKTPSQKRSENMKSRMRNRE
jgi:hypothetical protein